jgi:hypothetical protein
MRGTAHGRCLPTALDAEQRAAVEVPSHAVGETRVVLGSTSGPDGRSFKIAAVSGVVRRRSDGTGRECHPAVASA